MVGIGDIVRAHTGVGIASPGAAPAPIAAPPASSAGAITPNASIPTGLGQPVAPVDGGYRAVPAPTATATPTPSPEVAGAGATDAAAGAQSFTATMPETKLNANLLLRGIKTDVQSIVNDIRGGGPGSSGNPESRLAAFSSTGIDVVKQRIADLIDSGIEIDPALMTVLTQELTSYQDLMALLQKLNDGENRSIQRILA